MSHATIQKSFPRRYVRPMCGNPTSANHPDTNASSIACVLMCVCVCVCVCVKRKRGREGGGK